jgi:hypothetical protein
MARLTVREFANVVGLGSSGKDYVSATIILNFLCSQGVAKEVDRISTSQTGKGRKSVVYSVPENINFRLENVETVVEEMVTEEPVVVEETIAEEPVVVEEAIAVQSVSYDFGDDDDDDVCEAA